MEEESKKAAEKAMNLLLVQDRTKKGLEDRLYRAGFSEKAIKDSMAYVMSFGYIDDKRYATNYISYHKNRKSKKELIYKLMNRGVSKDVIREVMDDYDPEDEREAVCFLLKKKIKGRKLSGMDFLEKNKIIAYLGRKGYSMLVIKQMMRELQETQEMEEY